MLTLLLDRLQHIDKILAGLDENREVRQARRLLADVAKQITASMTLRDGTISVENEHEKYAVEAVTAYIDGASRGDGYELLGGVVAVGCGEAEGSVDWMAGVIGALARMAGDLAVLAASGESEQVRWEDALGIIQQMARDST